MARARRLRALRSSMPAKSLILPFDGRHDRLFEIVSSEELEVGDVVLVEAGDVIPVDGEVIDGVAEVDESAVTGESRVVTKEASDRVPSGVVNTGGPFDLLATATALGLALTTAVGVIDRIHDHTADMRALSLPSRPPGLAHAASPPACPARKLGGGGCGVNRAAFPAAPERINRGPMAAGRSGCACSR